MNISICGIPYLLTREDDALRVDHNSSGAKLWGQINYATNSIRFVASSPERELRTVLHEVIHGIIDGLAIRELVTSQGEHAEEPINQLAHGLAEALESLGFVLPRSANTALSRKEKK